MKFLTKECFNQSTSSNIHLLMSVTKAAESFSEEYFQNLYEHELKEYLKLHKGISELTADDFFPRDACNSISFVTENGELVDTTQYLQQDEIKIIKDDFLRKGQEANKNYEPEIYDEERLTQHFHNKHKYRIKLLEECLPVDILMDVADIRVLAFFKAAESIYQRIIQFCNLKEENAIWLEQDYRDFSNRILAQLPEKIRNNYGFHDCKVTLFEQEGTDVIIELDNRGGFTNVYKVIYHNSTVIEQENIVGSIWLYEEIYIEDGIYEFNTLLQDRDGQYKYFTLNAEDVDFEKAEK